MSKNKGFFILTLAALTSLFSATGFAESELADSISAAESSSPATVREIDAAISKLEDQKKTTDVEAKRLGDTASRLQFDQFLLARQMYSQQRRLEYKSEALEAKIKELKKRKAALQKA